MKLISDEDIARVTSNGVKIKVLTIKKCLFSNVSQDNIDRNVDILLQAQLDAIIKQLRGEK